MTWLDALLTYKQQAKRQLSSLDDFVRDIRQLPLSGFPDDLLRQLLSSASTAVHSLAFIEHQDFVSSLTRLCFATPNHDQDIAVLGKFVEL